MSKKGLIKDIRSQLEQLNVRDYECAYVNGRCGDFVWVSRTQVNRKNRIGNLYSKDVTLEDLLSIKECLGHIIQIRNL